MSRRGQRVAASGARQRDGKAEDGVRRTRVPNLRLDDLAVVLDAACREFHADGRLGVEVELVAREAAQQVGLADARVTNDDHCRASQVQQSARQGVESLKGAWSAKTRLRTLEEVVVVVVWTRRCACAGDGTWDTLNLSQAGRALSRERGPTAMLPARPLAAWRSTAWPAPRGLTRRRGRPGPHCLDRSRPRHLP